MLRFTHRVQDYLGSCTYSHIQTDISYNTVSYRQINHTIQIQTDISYNADTNRYIIQYRYRHIQRDISYITDRFIIQYRYIMQYKYRHIQTDTSYNPDRWYTIQYRYKVHNTIQIHGT